MKITSIDVVQIDIPRNEPMARARRPSWGESAEVANPMSRYPHVKQHRSMWLPKWGSAWCKITAEDGTWGLGPLSHAAPARPVVDHFAEQLIGEDCLAVERASDMMFRLSKPYGTAGLASYAVSAIDLALWDLKGRLLKLPVYSLIGGPQKEDLFCYCTGNDVDWYLELGFSAFKLACPYGPADGLDGIHRNEEFVARTRETIGDERELMLDCWMAFDVEYTVRLAEILRPYRLKWMEECLMPEDLEGHRALRRRLPWQTLATGEHWYTHYPFGWAAHNAVVDILQPDIAWCGGLTTCRKICDTADASGLNVILHGGGNTVYGQHFSFSMPSVSWVECYVGSPPGVPLDETWGLPGQAFPKAGRLVPSDAPGFGLDIPDTWLTPIQAT